MNDPYSDANLDALFARAREHRPDTSRAEYAFETRLCARLRGQRSSDPSAIWARVSWRLLPFFAVTVIALGVWHADLTSETDEVVSVAESNQPGATDFLDTSN